MADSKVCARSFQTNIIGFDRNYRCGTEVEALAKAKWNGAGD